MISKTMQQAFAESAARTGTSIFQEFPEPTNVKSKLSVARPQTHRLPAYVIWGITLSTPLIVALTNYSMVLGNTLLVSKKLEFAQKTIDDHGVLIGACVVAGVCVVYCGAAAILTISLAPAWAGSGLPENIGYLNGNSIPGMFRFRVFVVRVVGIVLSTSGGLPIGREGPMVCIGGSVGYFVVHLMALPFVRRWVKVNTDGESEDVSSAALVVDTERFAHAKRIGCALGGAAGIAVAFNAPIGGILYIFEMVTVSSWPPELTFRTFVCTVIAALASRGLLNLIDTDTHNLVIMDENEDMEGRHFEWSEMPLFAVMALFVGLCSALFTRALLFTWAARKNFLRRLSGKKLPVFKVVEVCFYAAVVAFCLAIVPLLFECSEVPHDDAAHLLGALHSSSADASHRRLSGDMNYFQYDCEEGWYNQAASVLLVGPEDAVKHLFSRRDTKMELGPLAGAVLIYTLFAAGCPGLSVPMGLFVPSMLIGALIGRICGEGLLSYTDWNISNPGVYAFLGSAAMLSGFTHFTIAIVVLLVEAAANLTLIAPTMLAISLSFLVSKAINHHAFDEVLILRKGVPYLEPEVPHEMDHSGFTASDLCEELPPEAMLKTTTNVRAVQMALDTNEALMDFPVVEAGRCVGLTTRSRLEAAVRALELRQKCVVSETSVEVHDHFLPFTLLSQANHQHEEEKELRINRNIMSITRAYQNLRQRSKLSGDTADESSGACQASQDVSNNGCSGLASWENQKIPVYRFMDPAPYTLLEDMPAPRFYPLFIKAGLNAACIVSKEGLIVGILTRAHLISKAANHHRPKGVVSTPSADIVSPAGTRSSSSRADPLSHSSHQELSGIVEATSGATSGATTSYASTGSTEALAQDVECPAGAETEAVAPQFLPPTGSEGVDSRICSF